MFDLHVNAIIKFLIILSVLKAATATSNWWFNVSSSYSITTPSSIEYCQNLYSIGATQSPNIQLYNYTSSGTLSGVYNETSSGTTQSQFVTVSYNTGLYGFYYYNDSSLIRVCSIASNRSSITPLYTIPISGSLRFMKLDPDYPLLYYAGLKTIGVLNISVPTNASVLGSFSFQQAFTPLNIAAMAVEPGGNVFLTNNAGVVSLMKWNVNDLRQLTINGITTRVGSVRAYTIVIDPKKRFIAVINEFGTLVYGLYPPHYLYYVFPIDINMHEMLFVDDYLIIPTIGSCPYRVLYITNDTSTGTTIYTFTQQNSICSTLPYTWVTGVRLQNSSLLLADGANNGTVYVQSVTTDASVNIPSAYKTIDYSYNWNKTTGRPPALYVMRNQDLVVDAMNVLPITTAQLKITDGKRDAYWNYIKYTITSVTPSGYSFQYLSNSTGTWSNTVNFYQSDIDSGNIRIQPSSAFVSQCNSGSFPSAIFGTITFTASDIWLRTVSSTVANFAVVCCPSRNATVSNSTTVSQVNSNPSNYTQFCNASMPGYYYDNTANKIKACPIGTFNPFIGITGTMRNSCFSCPVKSTTANVASTSWNSCTCAYCMLKPAEVLSLSSSNCNSVTNRVLRPDTPIEHPHTDRPIFYTFAAKTPRDGGITFFYNQNQPNGSYPGLEVAEVWFATYNGFRTILRNVTDAQSAPNSYNFYAPNYSPDFYTQSWVFFWKGYLAYGLVPPGYDPSTDFSFRDKLLSFLLRGNLAGTDPTFNYNIYSQFQVPATPIVNLGFGYYSCYSTFYSNSWNVAIDDMIDNYTLTKTSSTIKLASTFVNYGLDFSSNFTLTLIPAYSLNVTGWFVLGNINATWIDNALSYYNVNVSDPNYGTKYVIVRNDSTSNPANWPSVTSFDQFSLNNNTIFLKVLQRQSNFPESSFNVSFYPCHPWVRFCDINILASVNITFQTNTAISNQAFDINSWAILNGNSSISGLVSGSNGVFGAAYNPGRRWGSQIAFVSPSLIYLYGGSIDGSNFAADMWVFNTILQQWAKVGGVASASSGTYGSKGSTSASYWPPSTGYGALAYDSVHNCLWLYGGSGNMGSSLWKYDLSTQYWGWMGGEFSPSGCSSSIQSSTSQPCPVSRLGEMSVDAAGNLYMSMGYLTSASALQNAVWQFVPSLGTFNLLNSGSAGYNIASNAISSTTKYGTARQNQNQSNSMIPGSNFIYMFGGSNTTSGTPGNAVWIFDIVLNSFKQVSLDTYISSTVLNGLSYRTETSIPIYPRIRPVTCADLFGNIWIYGGRTGFYSALLSDLWVFNTVAETYQLISGTSEASSIATNATAAAGFAGLPGSSAVNIPPSSSTAGSLIVQSDTSNSRLLNIYLVFSDASSSENIGTQVWSINAFITPETPTVINKSISFDVITTQKVYIDRSLFEVRDYDTPAYQLQIKLNDSTKGYFQSAVNGSNLTYVTYEMVQSGLQAYFVPSKYIGSGSFSVPFTVTDQSGHSVSSSFSMTISCSDAHANSTTCACNPSYYIGGNSCTICPLNTYNPQPTYQSSCFSCPVGSSSNGTTGLSNIDNCVVLPGWYKQSSSNYTCALGYGYTSNNATCTICPINTYKDAKNMYSCTTCPVGSSTNGTIRSTFLTNCSVLPGFVKVNDSFYGCPQGYGFTAINSSCTACAVDSYQTGINLNSCTMCPTGSSTFGKIGGNSSANCTIRATFIVLQGLTDTYGCPAGTGLSSDNTSCITCSGESFQGSDSLNSCKFCPTGTTTFSQAGMIQCWNSTEYSYSNSKIICNPGFYANDSSCNPCAADTYKETSGNESCVACNSGYTTQGQTASKNQNDCAFISASSTGANSSSAASSSIIIGVAAAVGSLFLIALAVFGLVIIKRKRSKSEKDRKISANCIATGLNKKHAMQYGSQIVQKTFTREQYSPQSSPQSMYSLMTTVSPTNFTANVLSQRVVSTSPTQRTQTIYSRQSANMAFPGFLLVDSSTAYRKTEPIAEGGFATLYKGTFFDQSIVPARMLQEEPDLLNEVAIKIFKSDGKMNITQEQQIADLENEATVLYALMPLVNVVKLLAVSKAPEKAIIMKLYSENFDTLIHNRSCSVRNEILRAFCNSWVKLAYCFSCDLIEGVGGMHTLGINHMDLKPANCLLEIIKNPEPDQLKYRLVISDFGLARRNKSYNATKVNRLITAGLSSRYAAPEAWNIARILQKGFDVPDSTFKAIDAYSVSVCIWEFLSSKYPLHNVAPERMELLVSEGLRPSIEDLPVPNNEKETQILSLCESLLKEGFKAHPIDRILVEDMKSEYVKPELYS